VAELARALRFHGSRDKQTFAYVGYNSRLDELQAAVLRIMLAQLDSWCDGRRAGARAYVAEGLDRHVTLPVTPAGANPAWHLFVVTHPRADQLIGALNQAGVQARGYYRTPVHKQPAMAPYARDALSLPATDELAASNIALPISPVLRPEQAREVVSAIAGALA
jgi:dTDP-4-amino-4,6-dideoxygalactose transaminase